MMKRERFDDPQPANPFVPGRQPSLADVLEPLEALDLPPTRKRDLASAVRRACVFFGAAPSAVAVDMRQLADRWSALNAASLGVSPKTLRNNKANLLAAIEVSGVRAILRTNRARLSPAWTELLDRQQRRTKIYLSRLARFCSANGIDPAAVTTATVAALRTALAETSLSQRLNEIHRQTSVAWNAVACCEPGLSAVVVPSFRKGSGRVALAELDPGLKQEIEAYLAWLQRSDPFDPAARERALAPATIRLRREQILSMLSAYRDSGRDIRTLQSFADLIQPDAVKAVLTGMYQKAGRRGTAYLVGTGKTLAAIAREWVRASPEILSELKRLLSRLPLPDAGLTQKNRRFLAEMSDPQLLSGLVHLPDQLWRELSLKAPTSRTLTQAQVALAIALLLEAPIRMQNLIALRFSIHLALGRERGGGKAHLFLPAEEMKNGVELVYELSAQLAERLRSYRELAARMSGQPVDHLFIRLDGTRKDQNTLASQISGALHKRLGITMTPHQFRHLAAKIVLDDNPGDHETAKQFLGHKNLKTTVQAYAGLDMLRAGRRHAQLIERLRADPIEDDPIPPRRPKRRSRRLTAAGDMKS